MNRASGALLGGLLAAAAWAPAPADARTARGCAISLTAAADGSFAQAGYNSGPARLAKLAAATRERFTAAALRLCALKVLTPGDLARFGRLVVQNGEGATEPLLYQDPAMGPRVFIFQFAFQDGGPPEPAEFEQALRCWKRPKRCDFGD
ncbi:MAG TPA: hypothetical protein VF547_10455 [Allosphingosinicella sp.]|jgi:hypothetical protein